MTSPAGAEISHAVRGENRYIDAPISRAAVLGKVLAGGAALAGGATLLARMPTPAATAAASPAQDEDDDVGADAATSSHPGRSSAGS